MNFEFKNSAAALNRQEFCKKYHLKRAPDFYGFVCNEVGFLYRRASVFTVSSQNAQAKYVRVEWKRPLGGRVAHQYKYVLFHIPESKLTTERFYIKSVADLARKAKRYPILEARINIAYEAKQKHEAQKWREWFIEDPIEPKNLHAKLELLTN